MCQGCGLFGDLEGQIYKCRYAYLSNSWWPLYSCKYRLHSQKHKIKTLKNTRVYQLGTVKGKVEKYKVAISKIMHSFNKLGQTSLALMLSICVCIAVEGGPTLPKL